MPITLKNQPYITIGIMDRQAEAAGLLRGSFRAEGIGVLSGRFSAKAEAGAILLSAEDEKEISRSHSLKLMAEPGSTFTLFNVTIGNRFHWERKEDQTFQGHFSLITRDDGTLAAVNEILIEDYLKSVISSEMNPSAPQEFLKVHAILSRSWLLAVLDRKKKAGRNSFLQGRITENERIRWYDREDHDLFDVCADDHCQRYQGIEKIASDQARKAVEETFGMAIIHQEEICDARYSKACGGLTEEFETAWDDRRIPYLSSVSDAPVLHSALKTEEEASRWILSAPDVYCNTKDEALLEKILPAFDRETKDFFRWRVEYERQELEEILREKSGLDFGTIEEIVPLHRGPSGRLSRLKIVGSKKTMIVGKELEIRRWFSLSHLYSSAFVVAKENARFVFHGAGWGHGVGLCQIGAAVMADKGFQAEEILKHYFRNIEIRKIY
jgi:stage II sporulation protein D